MCNVHIADISNSRTTVTRNRQSIMTNLDTFIYLDSLQLKMYLHQLPESKQTKNKVKNTFGISLAGPKMDTTVEKETNTLNLYEEVLLLEKLLKSKKLVDSKRPKSMKTGNNNKVHSGNTNKIHFVREKITATKLIFPKEKTSVFNGLEHIAVWVSEPDPKHLGSEKEWEYTGMFLYLLETVGDFGTYHNVISGVSALLAMCNLIHGHNFFDRSFNKDGEETFGRWNYVHPIEKLKSLGAIVTETRMIDTLYRCRYITDEQSYTYNNEKYRVSDLLAYPIYIKTLD